MKKCTINEMFQTTPSLIYKTPLMRMGGLFGYILFVETVLFTLVGTSTPLVVAGIAVSDANNLRYFSDTIANMGTCKHPYKCPEPDAETAWRTNKILRFISEEKIRKGDAFEFRAHEDMNNTWIETVCPAVHEYFLRAPYFSFFNNMRHHGSTVLTTPAAARSVCLLSIIDRVCKAVGAQWMIYAGTHIGAIIHGGPIPWDDDFDVAIDARYKKEFGDYISDHPELLPEADLQYFEHVGPSKLWVDDPKLPRTRFGWGWPFIDIFFLATFWDEGVVKEFYDRSTCGLTWPIADIYPLRPYFFGGLEVPGPARSFAANRYKLEKCVMGSYNHRWEAYTDFCGGDLTPLTKEKLAECKATHSDMKLLDCCRMADHFPVVHILNSSDGVPHEVVAVREKVLHASPVPGNYLGVRGSHLPDYPERCFEFARGVKPIDVTLYNETDPLHFAVNTWNTPFESRREWGQQYGMEALIVNTKHIPNLDVPEVRNDYPKSCKVDHERGLRVIEYNAERGKDWSLFADMVVETASLQDPDVIILNEMDLGMARTKNTHTTRLMADKLRMNFAWGLEFMELTNGDKQEQLDNRYGVNLLGLHGNAILSKCPIKNAWIHRSPLDESFYTNKNLGANAGGFERRLGARMMLYATVTMPGGLLLTGSIHKLAPSEVPSVKEEVEKHGHAVFAGDQYDICRMVSTKPVDINTHNTWPATCESPGTVRGDIICSTFAVKKTEETLLPCFKGKFMSDHAIKVVDLECPLCKK